MTEFKPANRDDRYLYELMPILIGIGPAGKLLCYGSCFIAWPHMAVTAKHVVEELVRQDPAIARGAIAKFEYWVIQVVWFGDEHDYVVWNIDSIGTSPHSDIAIIWLRGMNDKAEQYKTNRQWKMAPMTFDPPLVGEQVRAFGIHNVRFDGSRINAEGKFDHIACNMDRSQSVGAVKAHYWAGRDRGLYNFPCFEVDARFEHGMSGGLVINDRSQVCGIVCGSLPPAAEGEQHVSYVTMLWPMMAIPVPTKLVEGGLGEDAGRYRLRDLSANGIFTPQGWERVLIDDIPGHPGGTTIRYQLRQ